MPERAKLANCERCGRQLQVSESRQEDSKPFRRSLVAKGYCPECVLTEFLYNTYPINMQLDEAGPELLLKPGIPEAFAGTILKGCEMDISEINWAYLVENWNLPVTIQKKNPQNPYRMGESPRSRSKNPNSKTPPGGEFPPLFPKGLWEDQV
jgi:hypothetical protein